MTIDKLLDNAKQELQNCEIGSMHHAFYSGYIKALQDLRKEDNMPKTCETRGNHTINSIVKRTGLSYGFIKRYTKVNYVTLMNLYLNRINGKLTDRDVKTKIYNMRLSEYKKDIIWNAYVRTYMSHICLNLIPIKEHSNVYVNYSDMIY